MKTIISLFISCITFSCFAAEPNFRIRFQDQYSGFRDCRALPNGVILAAGERGRMIRSTDNGEHWQTVGINTFAHFIRMDFTDNLHGVIADDSGRVWLTADAGATWQIAFTADQPLASIAFVEGNTFVAVGRRGGLWKGDIAIREWNIAAAGTDSLVFTDVAFAGHRGAALAEKGVVMTTTDGGQSWEKRTFAPEKPYSYKCGFITPSRVLLTTAGADDSVSPRGRAVYYRYDFIANVFDTISPGPSMYLLDFAVINSNDILAIGTAAYINHSYDGGATWQRTDTLSFEFAKSGGKVYEGIHCLSILSDGRGVAAGGYVGGVLSTTTDYGKTWTIRTEASGNTEAYIPYDGYAHSADSLLIVGGFRKRMYRTSDGGATWRRPYPVSSYDFSYFYRVHFVSKTRGYAVGQTGESPWCFATTSDGGATWSDIQQMGEYLTFGDAQHGYMTRFRSSPTSYVPIFFASKDSGATWSKKYIKDVGLTDSTGYRWIGVPHFATGNKGATILTAFNRATFYYTEDYGETWERRFLFDSTSGVEQIKWKSPNTVFAYGRNGALQRSDDEGKQWRMLNSGLTSISTLLFLNDSVGIVAGADGQVAVSIDGGETWYKVPVPTKKTSYEIANNIAGIESYHGLCRVNDTTAYLLGVSRVIRMVVTTDNAVGVNEALLTPFAIRISPNPAKELFTVYCTEGATITVRDVFGRVIKTVAADGNEESTVSTVEWPSGVYFVEVSGKENLRDIQKIMVVR